ncbi:MAG: DUF1330 domain-containing protein [Gammaproteobacteria bacterium]|nr:DUF1330 domain-containing protein [Gammaproteobacteria bacterium]
MPKGYWIVQGDIHDPEAYKAYMTANAEPFSKYGAKFLVRGGRFENAEGSCRSRHVVLEFPDYQSALECWHSPEYQYAISLRAPISELDIVIIEGYDD